MRILLIITLCISLLSCSNNKKTTPSAGSTDPTEKTDPNKKDDAPKKADTKTEDETKKYDLDIDVDLEKLDPSVRAFAEKIRRDDPISFDEITKLFAKKHDRIFKASPEGKSTSIDDDSIWKELSDVASKITSKDDIAEMKVQAETALGGNILYNKANYSIPHILKFKKLQCYLGTSFQQVMLRIALGAKNFQSKNIVVVITKGHVSYGYVKKDASQKWTLTRIESTNAGKGEEAMGPLENLAKYGEGQYRVIDADLWMILEILADGLKNSSAALKEVLDKTNVKYDSQIPVTDLEANIAKATGSGSSSSFEGVSSPTSFGYVDVHDGDVERAKSDTVVSSNVYRGATIDSGMIHIDRGIGVRTTGGLQINTREELLQKIQECDVMDTLEKWIQDNKLCPAKVFVEKPEYKMGMSNAPALIINTASKDDDLNRNLGNWITNHMPEEYPACWTFKYMITVTNKTLTTKPEDILYECK